MENGSDALTQLTRLLGTSPPPSIAALPAPVLERLVAQVRSARRQHATAVEDAIQAALRGVPLGARRVVRKALLG